jgi:hypothetical protein
VRPTLEEKRREEERKGVANQTLELGVCGSSKVCCDMLACLMTTVWSGKILCGAV